ncbi:MAG: NAD(+) synthase, partial [Clostridiales bacterium]|nr:NAD(+) synthase [Clostridiales bacterium]
ILRSAETRKTALSSKNKTIIYANAGMGESTTDFVYSGQCLVFESGELLAECKPFENIMAVAEIESNPKAGEPKLFEKAENVLTKKPFIPDNFSISDANELINIQAHGLAHRASHINAKSLVLGISGGLDSTLAILVCVKTTEILGKSADFVHAISMPCFGTSNRTRGNAKRLCELLKVRFEEIDISDSVTQHLKEIHHDFKNKNVVFENAQARMRTLVLMNLANAENGLVVGTGDLSELVLGFCTYNGDHMSMYGVNGSIPKTLMQAMVKAFADNNSELKAVLYDILETPISPELLPGGGEIVQITQNLIGSYDLNDFFIFHVLNNHFSPKKVFDLALKAFEDEFSPDEIKKWLIAFNKRFFASQFKRSCLPDGPQATVISVSPRNGLFMPSDAVVRQWLAEID